MKTRYHKRKKESERILILITIEFYLFTLNKSLNDMKQENF